MPDREGTDAGGGQDGPGTPPTARRPSLVDVAVLVALLVGGLAARRNVLPADGLLYDDAWVVAGASKAGFDDVFTVGTNHPGFTAGLMVWARAVSRASESFALPVMVAGGLGAAAAYLALRTQRVRTTLALAGAVLVVAAPVHLLYSGRVKPYAIETLVGFLLTALVPWAARRRWTWAFAAVWTGAAIAVGSASAFLTVMTGTATLIAALHPEGDRVRRVVAVGVQGVVQVALLLRVQQSFDSSRVAEEWETTYDGYLELEGGPWGFVRQVVTHLRRLGQMLVDELGSVPAVALVAIALAGLAFAAWRGERRVAGRMHLALLGLALVGGLARQIPFGPAEGNIVFPGGRASLWLLPSLVTGLAFAGEALLSATGAARPKVATALGAAVLLVAVVAVGTTWDSPQSSGTGMATAAREAERRTGPDDAIILHNAQWPYAAEPSAEVGIVADSSTPTGFGVTFTRPRTHLSSAWDGTPASLRRLVGDADRVVVVDGFVGLAPELADALAEALGAEGFREVAREDAWFSRATTWER